MATLGEIERMVKEFREARTVLRDRVQVLEDETVALKKKYINSIRKGVEWASEKQARLRAAIEQSPELFEQPRTLTLFGIKFGFMKRKGKLEWDDTETVVKLIKKYFPEEWKTYVKITEKPSKSALETLTVAELKKVGVTAEDAGDAVYIKPTDSEIDKFVDKLLQEEEIKEEKEAA